MILNELIPSILEFITYYIVLHLFLLDTWKPTMKDVLFALSVVGISVLGHNYSTVSWICGIFLYLLYTFSISSGNLIDRLLLYCLSYTSIVLFQLIIIFLVAFIDISYKEQYMSLIGNLLTIVIAIAAFRFTPYRHLYSTLKRTAFLYKILLINSYLIIAVTLLFMKNDTANFYKKLSFFITLTAILFIFNLYVIYYERNLQLEHQKTLSYQENLPIYKALIDEIRSNQHEFNNRILSLEQLPLTCKDYESLCHALSKNAREYKLPARSYALLQLNMPLLSATLYNLYTKAYDQHISMIFDIASTDIQSHAPEYILSDFVSILTENALEACSPGDNIYIRISCQNETMQFEIRNPSETAFSINELGDFFKKGYSTKGKKGRGLGLYYLEKEIKQYNGTLGADCAHYGNQSWVIISFGV